jgi:D-aminopeptidase
MAQQTQADGQKEKNTPLAVRPRARELGLEIGILSPGRNNAITDVAGVSVGHFTFRKGTRFNTGITAVLPHDGNLYQERVPAAICVGNGFGKLMGSTQVNELGELETPILLTGTLNVAKVADGLISYMLSLPGMEAVRSINPVVGETNDGFLSDIRARPLGEEQVRAAIESADSGPVEMGAVGAGTGTVCFGFKGGIGSASRKLSAEQGGWTVGVLVQSNFGGPLRISGLPTRIAESPLGQFLQQQADRSSESSRESSPDGSLMIVVATDAPLSHRNLRRLAERSLYGMARLGGYGSNGSGDYAIAFCTHPSLRMTRGQPPVISRDLLDNDALNQVFLAVVEATEEAILDSMFTARTTAGFRGTIRAIPVQQVLELVARRNRE